MELRNVANCILYVDDGDGNVAINPGEVMDVDGRKPWNDHLFVTAGMLEVVEVKQSKKKQTEK